MDVVQSRIERGELTFNATLADALAGYGFTFDPNRKTAVASLMCFTDAESGNAFTANNPKLYGELDALFNQALPLYEFRKNRTMDAKKNAEQFKLEKRADAILRSPLRMFYGIEETAQAPVDISNPLVEVMEELHDVKNAVTRTADNTEEIVGELSVWCEWIKGKCKDGGKKNGKRSKLIKDMRDAILDYWKRFNKGEADCELPNGKLRRAKRAVAEFFEQYSATIIYTSKVDGKQWTLKQMCHTVKELETAIDSAQKSERRANTKATKRKADKKNGQQKM